VPVLGVVREESEAVELAVCCDEFGNEVRVLRYVDGEDVMGEGEGQTRYHEGSCEHVVCYLQGFASRGVVSELSKLLGRETGFVLIVHDSV